MRWGSIEAVIAALQEDANAEIEKIDRDLAAAIARLREEDAALPVIVPDAETRVAAARRAVRDRLAAEDWADRLAVLRNREEWIARVSAEGARRLSALDAAALRSDFADLVRDAFDRIPNGSVELRVPAAYVEFAETLLRDGTLVPPAGTSVSRVIATADVASGCILQTADGRIRYENSYATRVRRLEGEWRAQLGALYEEQPEAAVAGRSVDRSVA